MEFDILKGSDDATEHYVMIVFWEIIEIGGLDVKITAALIDGLIEPVSQNKTYLALGHSPSSSTAAPTSCFAPPTTVTTLSPLLSRLQKTNPPLHAQPASVQKQRPDGSAMILTSSSSKIALPVADSDPA